MKVRVFGTLRAVVTGNKEIEVHIDGRSTALEVLDKLATVYPDLRRKVFGESGKPPAGVTILVNGRSIRFLDGFSTLVEDGDELALFPPIGGG